HADDLLVDAPLQLRLLLLERTQPRRRRLGVVALKVVVGVRLAEEGALALDPAVLGGHVAHRQVGGGAFLGKGLAARLRLARLALAVLHAAPRRLALLDDAAHGLVGGGERLARRLQRAARAAVHGLVVRQQRRRVGLVGAAGGQRRVGGGELL